MMTARLIPTVCALASALTVLVAGVSAEAIPNRFDLFENMRDRSLCPDGCQFVPAGAGYRIFAAQLRPSSAIMSFDCISIGRDGNGWGRSYCGLDIGSDRSLMIGIGAIAEVRGLPLHHAFAARLNLWCFTFSTVVHFGDSETHFQTFLMFDLARLATR